MPASKKDKKKTRKTSSKRKATSKKRQYRKRLSKIEKQQKPKVVIGLVYANWCGHCQALKNDEMSPWQQLHSRLNGPEYEYAEIDADNNRDQDILEVNQRLNPNSQPLKADGYPTIFRIKNGNLDYYNGERSAPELIRWFGGGDDKMNGGCGCNAELPKLS